MIIALTGLAGSGKNTVADMIPGPKVAFAEPLKRFCGEVFGFTREELYGPSEARERPSKSFARPDGTPLTARYALQTLGTEWGRNCDPDIWAKAGVAEALRCGEHCQYVTITDLRFTNEAKLVREAGGQVWRIRRGDGAGMTHASERDVWAPEMAQHVTYEIDNNGTFAELAERVCASLELLERVGR